MFIVGFFISENQFTDNYTLRLTISLFHHSHARFGLKRVLQSSARLPVVRCD